MAAYILRRIFILIPILFGVTFLTFAVTQVTPGDPVVLMLGPRATPEKVAVLREHLGLDDPLLLQYGRYVSNVLRGDLGRSIRGQTPVLAEILLRLPSTLELAVTGLALAMSGGLTAGIVAAMTRGKWVDRVLTAGAISGLSIPVFWLAPILIIVFGLWLKWLPITGGEGLQTLILPGICLALAPAAILTRLTRASMLDVIQQSHVYSARAKGVNEWFIHLHHVLPNALIPVVTVLGLIASSLITGTVFIEVIFARPGLGRFTVNAIINRDFPQIQGIVLFTAVVYVIINLLVDLVYAFLDPRIRYG